MPVEARREVVILIELAKSSTALTALKLKDVTFRGISRLGSVFMTLQSFKLAYICFQLTSLHKGYEV